MFLCGRIVMPHLNVSEEVVQTNQPHVVKERDSDVLGVSGHVDHLADVQQARVVERERQVRLDEARRGTAAVAFQISVTSLRPAIRSSGSQLCHEFFVDNGRKIYEAPSEK